MTKPGIWCHFSGQQVRVLFNARDHMNDRMSVVFIWLASGDMFHVDEQVFHERLNKKGDVLVGDDLMRDAPGDTNRFYYVRPAEQS